MFSKNLNIDDSLQEKENIPFTISRRPVGNTRKHRLNFGESMQANYSFDDRVLAGQDMVDEEVYSLCSKFSSTSIRCDEYARKKCTFESILTEVDQIQNANISTELEEGGSQGTPHVTPHVTPQQSPSSGRITPRKPLRPLKSASRSDPSFKGVIFTVRSGMKRSVSMEEFTPEAFIDSVFSARKRRPKSTQPSSDSKLRTRRSSTGRPRRNCKTPVRLFSSSPQWSASPPDMLCSDDGAHSNSFASASSPPSCEEDFGLIPIHVEKECASCGTSKTPLWRDAEDGTHLCNACGIRWKKYKIRCVRCWYIPRKEEKMMKQCPSCTATGTVRMAWPKMAKKH
eukprot:gene491-1136_t